jgi:hypothetical protein
MKQPNKQEQQRQAAAIALFMGVQIKDLLASDKLAERHLTATYHCLCEEKGMSYEDITAATDLVDQIKSISISHLAKGIGVMAVEYWSKEADPDPEEESGAEHSGQSSHPKDEPEDQAAPAGSDT